MKLNWKFQEGEVGLNQKWEEGMDISGTTHINNLIITVTAIGECTWTVLLSLVLGEMCEK